MSLPLLPAVVALCICGKERRWRVHAAVSEDGTQRRHTTIGRYFPIERPTDAPEYEEKGGLKLSERRTAISVGRWTGSSPGLGWPAGSRLFHRASFLTGRRPVPWPEGCGG